MIATQIQTVGAFIAGEEVESASGQRFPVMNPMTQTVMGEAARCNDEDANRAVLVAQDAAPLWANLPPAERELIMLRCADSLEAHLNRLSELVVDESGSTLAKAVAEVRYGASLVRTAAGEARRLYGDTFPNDKPHRLSFVTREPLGVVVAISPFNAPLSLFLKMVVFALSVGNAVISKPSEETPLIAVEVAKLFHQAGMPSGVFQVLTGYGQEVGAALVEHRGVQGIAFTGSTATGVRIGQLAMPTMKRLQLELGGKNPLLVLADYDIEKAANIAAVGAFFHAGQICMSGSRLIVEDSIARPFAEALAAKANSLHLGDLRDANTAYGPVINEASLRKVERHVSAGLASGAELLAGGQVRNGWVYEPTVLWQPTLDSLVWREETFGPVVSIVPFSTLEQAITLANDSDMGLSAGILTNDLQRGMNAARQIRCGGVHVGSHPFQSDALAPVGGFGMSGVGRSGGKYSVDHFTELKWLTVELGEAARPF
jgi:aldehyde dehydrogenase (NAD+)